MDALKQYCADRGYTDLRPSDALGVTRWLATDSSGGVVLIPADIHSDTPVYAGGDVAKDGDD